MTLSLLKHKNNDIPLILDASVVINLMGSGQAEAIVDAIGCPVLLEENVRREFRYHPRDGRDSQRIMDELVNGGRFSVIQMSPVEYDRFLEFTGAPSPDDLGDGEAATLACAVGRGVAAIDDRKALRIAGVACPEVHVYCSMDIICAEHVIDRLTEDTLRAAVFDAIRYSRMHVPDRWHAWTCKLIGCDPRAIAREHFSCNSPMTQLAKAPHSKRGSFEVKSRPGHQTKDI